MSFIRHQGAALHCNYQHAQTTFSVFKRKRQQLFRAGSPIYRSYIFFHLPSLCGKNQTCDIDTQKRRVEIHNNTVRQQMQTPKTKVVKKDFEQEQWKDDNKKKCFID